METVALVLAGGVGTRLYPASRSDHPKQFRSFGGGHSLLERAVDRGRAVADGVAVLTRPAFADRVREFAPRARVLVEPEPRDTGPALAYGAHRLREQFEDPALLCLPSDHHVGEGFGDVAARALRVARDTGELVTMGVVPDRPEPGYGYVQAGAFEDGHAPVERFREKPDRETAREYVAAGHLWNAGIFAWTADAFLREARDTELAEFVEALDEEGADAAFAGVESRSVDYAVLETSEQVRVVRADFEWDDLGAWDALARVLEGDGDGNAVLGEALTVDATDNVLASEDHHVSAVGVEGLAVAAFDDRVLVVPLEDAQRVREVVARLRETGDF